MEQQRIEQQLAILPIEHIDTGARINNGVTS